VRQYANLFQTLSDAAASYRNDVANGSFPSADEAF